MKKIFLLMITMLTGMMTASADNGVVVSNVSAPQGGSGSICIELDNDDYTFTAFTFKLTLPEGVNFVLNSAGKPSFSLSARFGDHSVSSSVAGQTGTFGCLSLSSAAISGTGGTLLTIPFTANGSLAANTVLDATLSELTFTTTAEQEVSFNDVGFKITITQKATAATKNIAEGVTSYSNNEEMEYETLTYSRTFKNTGWQALYVPFSMTLSDWEEDFEVARISTIFLEDLDGNGETSREEQKLLIVKIGEAQRGLRLRPNYPYLIKAKRASTTPQTITLHNATLYRTEENAVDCSTLENKFTFTGIYQQKSGLNIPGLYYMGSGKLAYTSSATTKLNPFRWYMQMTERDGSLLPEEALPGEIKLMVVDEDGAITSIEDMEGFSEKDALDREGWWTLSGVQLSGKPAARGIYIHNGKKVSIQ